MRASPGRSGGPSLRLLLVVSVAGSSCTESAHLPIASAAAALAVAVAVGVLGYNDS